MYDLYIVRCTAAALNLLSDIRLPAHQKNFQIAALSGSPKCTFHHLARRIVPAHGIHCNSNHLPSLPYTCYEPDYTPSGAFTVYTT